MGDYHKKKELEKSNRRLVFSQKSLDDWKKAQLEQMRNTVMDEVSRKQEENIRIINQHKEAIAEEAVEQALTLLLGIPCKVMKEKYGWGKKRITSLCEYILEYYNDFQNGEISIDEYRKSVWEDVGIGFTVKDGEETYESAFDRYEREMENIE
jgi:hypothetical protein